MKLYKKYIYPFLKLIVPGEYWSCRYYPTCSQYFLLALKKYGIFKGTYKSIWRIIRCNPYSKGGIDYP